MSTYNCSALPEYLEKFRTGMILFLIFLFSLFS